MNGWDMNLQASTTSLLLFPLLASAASAAFLTVDLPGNTDYDGWGEGFNNTRYPGYGTYPGTGAWPSPIGSDTLTSDAYLEKVTGSGYPSTTPGSNYIYSTLAGAQAANTDPSIVVGTFSVVDDTPLAALETVVFQIQISYWTNLGAAFPTGVLPTLNYNGGSQSLQATDYALVHSGAFESSFGSGIADFWAFQWDLSSLEEPITSFEVVYSVTNHAQTYALELHQGDEYTRLIPEPSGVLLLSLSGSLAFLRRRR